MNKASDQDRYKDGCLLMLSALFYFSTYNITIDYDQITCHLTSF